MNRGLWIKDLCKFGIIILMVTIAVFVGQHLLINPAVEAITDQEEIPDSPPVIRQPRTEVEVPQTVKPRNDTPKIEKNGIVADIQSDHWAYDAVHIFINKGILKNSDVFDGDAPISRSEMVVWMYKLFQTRLENPMPFNDFSHEQLVVAAVISLSKAGIVDGYNNGSFNGNKSMTKYEGAVIIAKLLGKTARLTPGRHFIGYADVSKRHWAYVSVQYLVDYGILDSRGAVFSGDKELTKFEAAYMLANAVRAAGL